MNEHAAYRRRLCLRPDAHLAVRPDAHLFRLSEQSAAYRPVHPDDRKHLAAELCAPDLPPRPSGEAELRAWQASLTEAEALLAELRRELARARLDRKYSPDQPRVPGGNPDGGQWTREGGGWTPGGRAVRDPKVVSEPRIRLAGPMPTNDTPEVPPEKPPTAQERNRVARTVANWVSKYGGPIGRVLAGAYWLYEEYPNIKSYQDPPKSLQEVQDAVSQPRRGYDIHHIVERTSAEQDGFPRS
jgi:hypothetical protein